MADMHNTNKNGDIWWRIMEARDRCASLSEALADEVLAAPWDKIEWPLVSVDSIRGLTFSSILRRQAG